MSAADVDLRESEWTVWMVTVIDGTGMDRVEFANVKRRWLEGLLRESGGAFSFMGRDCFELFSLCLVSIFILPGMGEVSD